jgi:hypothetical protein
MPAPLIQIPHAPRHEVPITDWDTPRWAQTPTIAIDQFRPESSEHRPQTRLKLSWDEGGLNGLFQVHDRYVRCVHTGFQAPVYQDSCVEVFLQPKPEPGYFNFEFNAGGALLASYVTDPTRLPDGGLRQRTLLTEHQCRQISVATTLPAVIEPEIAEPIVWRLGFRIPFALLAEFIGPATPQPGARWRGNFYKCGDATSHPHWAAWAAVPALNFHSPDSFGALIF